MSAKFPRRGGGAGPFLARSLIGQVFENASSYFCIFLAKRIDFSFEERLQREVTNVTY